VFTPIQRQRQDGGSGKCGIFAESSQAIAQIAAYVGKPVNTVFLAALFSIPRRGSEI
jgi:hypothetical protein